MQCILVFAFLIGSTVCLDDFEMPNVPGMPEINEGLNEIPGFENFNQSALPSIGDVEDALKKKCEKNGGAEAFERLSVAKDEIQECITSNFNFTQIYEELEVAKKTGSMDEVFEKHCRKRPLVMECVKNLTQSISPCLDEEEKPTMELLLNVTDNLANFSCYKDGDRLAMFIAEGGFECIQNQRDGLEQCANKTFSHRIPTDFSLESLPALVVTEDSCRDFGNFHECAVKVLEGCADDTPANIVDALFKYIRRITPCKDYSSSSSNVIGVHRIIRSFEERNGIALNNGDAAFLTVKERFLPLCLTHGGPAAADRFNDVLNKMRNCLTSNIADLIHELHRTNNKMPYEYTCNNYRLAVRSCLSALADAIKACSDPREAYVPQFGLDLFDSVFRFHCKDSARNLKVALGDKDACLKRIFAYTNVCLGKTKHMKTYDQNSFVTKTELCSDLKLLRGCFLGEAVQHCPASSSTHDYINGFSDALYAPCSGCRVYLECILIVIAVFIKLF